SVCTGFPIEMHLNNGMPTAPAPNPGLTPATTRIVRTCVATSFHLALRIAPCSHVCSSDNWQNRLEHCVSRAGHQTLKPNPAAGAAHQGGHGGVQLPEGGMAVTTKRTFSACANYAQAPFHIPMVLPVCL